MNSQGRPERSSRFPSGERGLKYQYIGPRPDCQKSLPIRGAWIEIALGDYQNTIAGMSLPIRGAWIEMPCYVITVTANVSRFPSGERGLKLRWNSRAWQPPRWSLPIRGAWIEILWYQHSGSPVWSLPIRGAWIEIIRQAPRLGCIAGRFPSGERGLKFIPSDVP